MRVAILTMMMCSLMMIGSGCVLQPVNRVVEKFNFIDIDSPALRLAHPVEAELLEKVSDKEWRSIGRGLIPAGAYIRGRAPEGMRNGNGTSADN